DALSQYPTVNPIMTDPDRGSGTRNINPGEGPPDPVTTFFFSNYDAVVTILNAQGSNLSYSTYLGSTADDYGLAIAVDPTTDNTSPNYHNIYVTGMTRGNNWPIRAPVETFQGGNDAFVAKINPAL